jgi:hypothetical protein
MASKLFFFLAAEELLIRSKLPQSMFRMKLQHEKCPTAEKIASEPTTVAAREAMLD